MKELRKFNVVVEWDDEAQVWYVCETDVPGLATEAANLDDMVNRLRVMVPELLELNGVISRDDNLPAIPFSLMVDKLQSTPVH